MTAPADIEKHIISILVDNEPGVLARVIGLFSGRGYNIESLTVAEVNRAENLSRITIENRCGSLCWRNDSDRPSSWRSAWLSRRSGTPARSASALLQTKRVPLPRRGSERL